jgi:hypothetical protein
VTRVIAELGPHGTQRHRGNQRCTRMTNFVSCLQLPERSRDEGGPREARSASWHRLGSQVPEQRQGWGPKAPEGLDRHSIYMLIYFY